MEDGKKVEIPPVTTTLYDLNKSAYRQKKPLSKMKKRETLEKINRVFNTNRAATHYMFLCNEKHYYTIFEKAETASENFIEVLEECIDELGEFLEAEVVENSAFEIWIKIEEEPFCFMLFDYSNGVIEVKG